MKSSNTQSETLNSLLPSELLIDIFALCRPSIHLPASSRTTAAHFSSTADSQVFRSWLHRVVFLDPQYDPCIVNQSQSPAQLNHRVNVQFDLAHQWHSVGQIESHVAYFLKALVPVEEGWNGWAAGLAPSPNHAPAGAPVITKSLVEWPFIRKRVGGDTVRVADESDFIDELQRIRGQFGQVQSSPAFNSWQVLPDALLIVAFFIRTSQLDLLQLALSLLKSRFPFLGSTAAQFSLWSYFMLNNHINLLAHLRAVTGPDLTMTYPSFLCLLALIDWSTPALDIISRTFYETIDLSTVANLVLGSRPYLFQAMVSTFCQLDTPTSLEPSSRVLSVINWIRAHATTTTFHHKYSPYFSFRIYQNHRLFSDVLSLHDLTPDIPHHPSKPSLGSAVAYWVKKGYSQTLPLALQHHVLCKRDKYELLHCGAMAGDVSLMGLLAAQCIRDGDFQRVVRRALTYGCPTDADPPRTRAALFNLLLPTASLDVDYVCSTTLLTDHARQLSSRIYLQGVVARYSFLDLLSIEWDYTAFLQKHLRDGRPFPLVSATNVEFWGKLIATCMSHGVAWDQLSLKDLLTVCALQLMSFMSRKGMDWRKSADMRTGRVTDDEAKVISYLVQLTRARLEQSKAAAAGNMNRDRKKARTYVWGNAYYSFSQLLPHDCWHSLRDGIIAVATIPPLLPLDPHAHARESAHANLAHDFFLDTMLVLDAQFVYELIPFHDLVNTLRLWTRLDFRKFVRPRNRLPLVLGTLRSAAVAGDVDRVTFIVGGLPESFRTSKGFVLGLRGIMRRDSLARGALKLGLETSRSWWREREETLDSDVGLSRANGDGRADEEDVGEQFS